MQEQKDAIKNSRKHQIVKKQQERDQEKNEAKEFAAFWKIRNDELSIAEQQEKEEERQRQSQLKQFQKNQADAKFVKGEQEFRNELENDSKSQALLDNQEKQFYSYAEKCVKEWQDAGKNVKPLIMELKGYKKRLN